MNAVHILPKSLNYLATSSNTDRVHRLFDLGANEDVLRALFIENSAEFDVLKSEEIYQFFKAILHENTDKLKIVSTGLVYKNSNVGTVSIQYALVDDLNSTIRNKTAYVSGNIQLETKIDSQTKHIDLDNVISHSCNLNVFYDDESDFLPHGELTVFKDQQFYSNAYFTGARLHKTVMHKLEQALDVLRSHIYT